MDIKFDKIVISICIDVINYEHYTINKNWDKNYVEEYKNAEYIW